MALSSKNKQPPKGGVKTKQVTKVKPKPKNNAPKRGDTSWMNKYKTPTQKEFTKYLGAQKKAFAPSINTLTNQIASMQDTSTNPVVSAYHSMLASLPSNESVSGAYRTGLDKVASYLQGIDMSRAGAGVSSVVNALGGALGVPGASDIATTAGTVSGVGTAGGDIMTKALMQGAAGQFANLEADRLTQLAEQRQGLTLGAGEAAQNVISQRQELSRNLADIQGQQIGTTPNPFDIANTILQYQSNTGISSGGGDYSTPAPKAKKTPQKKKANNRPIGQLTYQQIAGTTPQGYATGYPTGSIKPVGKLKVKQVTGAQRQVPKPKPSKVTKAKR